MRASACAFLLSAIVTAEDWPGFRGPSRQGISSERGIPAEWSSETNVVWKTPIPGEGWSSPIVAGGRVFVTTATDAGRTCRVVSVDASSGKLLWDTKLFEQTPLRKEAKNSYASPTPVTDGRMVYAVFGDGSFAALKFNGSIAWTNREFRFYGQHGLGASPILHEDLLIMPFDGSSDGEDKKIGWQKPWDQSFLIALDKNTGKTRWKARRGMSRIAHVTPNIATVDGKPQIISAAGDVIQGFDPRTGRLIWTVRSQGEGVVPSIVIGDGVAFAGSGFEKPTLRAIRLGGAKGDATDTHVLWEQTRMVPKIPSFIYVKPHLFVVMENGIAAALDASTGAMVWQERLGGEFSASPVFVDGRILFTSEGCETAAVKPGAKFELLGRSTLEGRCQASPAVSDGRLFVRTDTMLYAIGHRDRRRQGN